MQQTTNRPLTPTKEYKNNKNIRNIYPIQKYTKKMIKNIQLDLQKL